MSKLIGATNCSFVAALVTRLENLLKDLNTNTFATVCFQPVPARRPHGVPPREVGGWTPLGLVTATVTPAAKSGSCHAIQDALQAAGLAS